MKSNGEQIRCRKKHTFQFIRTRPRWKKWTRRKNREKKKTFATCCCRQLNIQCYSINVYVYAKQRDGTIYSIGATIVDQLLLGNSMLSRCFRLFSAKLKKKLLKFMFDWLHCCNQSLKPPLVEKVLLFRRDFRIRTFSFPCFFLFTKKTNIERTSSMMKCIQYTYVYALGAWEFFEIEYLIALKLNTH